MILLFSFCRYKTAETDSEAEEEEEESDGDDEITSKRKRKKHTWSSEATREAARQRGKNTNLFRRKRAKKEAGIQDSQLLASFASNSKFKCVRWIQKETRSGEKMWTLGLTKADKILSKMEELQEEENKAYADLPPEKRLMAILQQLKFHVLKEVSSSDGDGKGWGLVVFHPDVQKESDGSVDMMKVGTVTHRLAKTVNPFAEPNVKKVRVDLSVNPRFNSLYLGMFPKDKVAEIRATARKIIVDNYSATDTELFKKLRAARVTERLSNEEKEAKKRREESRIALPRQNVRVGYTDSKHGSIHLGYYPPNQAERIRKEAKKISKANPSATKEQLTKLLVAADVKKGRILSAKRRSEEGSTGKAKRAKTSK